VDGAAQRVLDRMAAALRARPAPPGLAVAFSGGVDSSILLEGLLRVAPAAGWPAPRALYVDHGLRRESAQWGRHCARVCAARGVRFEAITVDARPRRGESPEAVAREARYAALVSRLAAGEVLAVGHQADDQAETLLLALLRGSGPPGLAAMAGERHLGPGRLLRPMLGLRRREIEAAAREWRLEWLRDPANDSAAHPRNRLRMEVLPLLEEVAPGAVRTLSRAAGLQAEAAEAVAALAALDLERCVEGEALSREALAALPSGRRRAVLRLWLQRRGLRPPGAARLREGERQIVTARTSRLPCIRWPGGEVRVYAGRVYLRETPPRSAVPGDAARIPWRPPEALALPGGRLVADPVVGVGLRRDGPPLEVGFRRGGERCRPSGRRHRQSLKRLLQERRVPPWLRAGLPLVWRGGELVAVADLWVCAGHEAGPGEPGWRIRWHEPDASQA
jgi:tRNA(Ile)-lysidine synthase